MIWLVVVAALGLGLYVGGRAGYRGAVAERRVSELKSLFTEYRNLESLQQAFVALLRQRAAAEAIGDHPRVAVLNAAQFLVIWNWDVVSGLQLLRTSKQPWEKKLHARVLALTVYESLVKVRGLLDPQSEKKWAVFKALRSMGVDEVKLHRLEGVGNELQAILDTHHALLKGIRNNAIGHRDVDVSRQMDWIKQADVEEITSLGFEIVVWLTSAIDAFSEHLTSAST